MRRNIMKTGSFWFAVNRKFLLCVDTICIEALLKYLFLAYTSDMSLNHRALHEKTVLYHFVCKYSDLSDLFLYTPSEHGN